MSWKRKGPEAARKLPARDPPPSDSVARGKNSRPASRLSHSSSSATTRSAAVRFPARARGLAVSIGSARLYRTVAGEAVKPGGGAVEGRSAEPPGGRRRFSTDCGNLLTGFSRGQRHRQKNPRSRSGARVSRHWADLRRLPHQLPQRGARDGDLPRSQRPPHGHDAGAARARRRGAATRSTSRPRTRSTC